NLIVKGELPDEHHFAMWRNNITTHSMVHENIKKFMDGFRYDAHPMGMLIATVGALSTFYPEAKHVTDLESRRLQTRRLIGKMPTLAAFAYRRSRGLPYVYPDNDLSYTGNFLSMLFKMTELRYKPDPVLERTVDVLFILHAEHEQNCSTNAVRCVASARTDPYSAVAAGIAALYGPLHGGANEEVIRMLEEIGTVDWMAHWAELIRDPEQKIIRPRQIYVGEGPRAYTPIEGRPEPIMREDAVSRFI